MEDGSKYLISIDKLIELEITDTMTSGYIEEYKAETGKDATAEDARTWAVRVFSGHNKPENMDYLFAGTDWDDVKDSATRLPDREEEVKSPHNMWDNATEFEFIPSNQ